MEPVDRCSFPVSTTYFQIRRKINALSISTRDLVKSYCIAVSETIGIYLQNMCHNVTRCQHLGVGWRNINEPPNCIDVYTNYVHIEYRCVITARKQYTLEIRKTNQEYLISKYLSNLNWKLQTFCSFPQQELFFNDEHSPQTYSSLISKKLFSRTNGHKI